VRNLLRGPFGRLGEAIPEARYEVIQALLRASICLTGAFTILTVSDSEGLFAPALVSCLIGLVSFVAAVGLARVTDPDRAKRYGRWSTVVDVVVFAACAAAFHRTEGAGGVYGVYVLLVGPLRYGLRGVPATVIPVGVISILLPQADQVGSHIDPAQVVLLCIGFTFPAIAVRAVLMRGSGRLRQAEQMLLHQAAHDPLTDLPNRHRALGLLDQALADGEQVAVLFLDLDRFKVVNDGMGHAEGDLLLVQVAARLRDVMRSDDLVGRLGGDEFVVLCRNADVTVAESVAGRVLGALSAPMTTSGGLQLAIGASIGIAVGAAGDEGDLLLADADTAMYAAKAAGGGRARVFSADLREALVRSHELELDLRRAVRAGQLALVYQPMLDLATGSVASCEALCRWTDERWGTVGPDEFIAVAEQSDLILELGDWVLKRALADAATWPTGRGGLPPVVSVNVSLRQLASAGFADRVAAVLSDAGVPATQVCIEVTETMLAGDVAPVVEVLEDLRALGLQLSIDDFGTGHASLTYLAKFPVDQVKVDRSFVSGLGADAGSAAIVGGVVAMAHTFDLRVTAEGVETDEQLQILRDLGCDFAQGYLLSVPLSHHDLCAFLASRTPQLHIPAPRSEAPLGKPQAPLNHDRLLLEGARQVSAQTDLASILDSALDALHRCIAFTGGAIALVQDGQLRLAACHPTPTEEALAARLPVGQGVSGSIALTGEPRYLPDITIASTVPASRRKHAAPGVRSWYGVPLISDGQVVGIFQVDHTEVDAFDEDDRLAVLSFAPVVALALSRAGALDQRGVSATA
jgi:diguanylate cyclase (GGDEF)-like protein